MITLDQVKIIREKKKDNPDQINLFGNNSDKKKKYTPPSKEKSDAIQSRSANRDAKKYASGEYPKIGGGERITPKSKGPGASTGGTKIPPATVGGKNKGTTPVKVNITKPVKQSEVSKKAKQFTTKINKANVNRKEFTNKVDKMRRAAQRSIKRQFPGDKSGAYQAMKADIDSKNLIKKAGGSGDIGFTAPDRKTKVTKRTTRAVKQGTPDPFSTPTPKKPIRPFGDKPVKTGLDKGDTSGQIKVKAMDKKAFKITEPSDIKDPTKKRFDQLTKDIKKYRVEKDIDKKIANPNLDISKEIKQRKINKKFADQQNIPGLDTTPKKSSRVIKKKIVKTPKNIQKSIPGLKGVTDTPVRTTPKGGPLVTTSKGIDPEVVQGRFSSNKELKDQEKKIRDALNKAREQGRAAGGGSGKPPKGPKVTTGGSGPFGMRPSDKMSGINPKAKVGLGKKVLRYIKKKPGKAALIGAVAVGAGAFAYDRIKKAISGPTLTKKDFTKTAPIQNRQGEKVTFKYARKNDKTKDKASPYLTSDALKKFKTGDYKVSTKSTPTKKGTPINVNQNIKNSAFEKQLQRLEKNPEKNKKFLSTVKNATRPT